MLISEIAFLLFAENRVIFFFSDKVFLKEYRQDKVLGRDCQMQRLKNKKQMIMDVDKMNGLYLQIYNASLNIKLKIICIHSLSLIVSTLKDRDSKLVMSISTILWYFIFLFLCILSFYNIA